VVIFSIIIKFKAMGRTYAMGKVSKDPRYAVVSMRINENELKLLNTLIDGENKNVSGIMREALELYSALHTKPVGEKIDSKRD
jgi:hypothetical protein